MFDITGKMMSNITQIQMTPTAYHNQMPTTWDLSFADADEVIGVMEKFEDGFIVTTSFNDAFIAKDNNDLSDLLTDLFCPSHSDIN